MAFADAEILFNQIKMSNAAGAARAVRGYMQQGLVAEHCAAHGLPDIPTIFEENYDSLASNQWGSLAAALEELAPHAELLGLDNLGRIVAMCRERTQEEDRLAMSSIPGALELWRETMHLNSEFLIPRLRKDIEKAGFMKYPDSIFRDFGTGIRGLYEAVRHITNLEPEAGETENMKAWEEVLFFRLPQIFFKFNTVTHDFGSCEFCWRLAPIDQSTGQGRFFCHLHQRNSREYRRLKKIEKFFYSSPAWESLKTKGYRTVWHAKKDEAKRMFASVRMQWPMNWRNLPDDLDRLYSNDIVGLSRMMTKTITYPFDVIQKLFPRVVEFVRDHGGTPEDPLSLVETLNPYPPISSLTGETEEVHAKRRAMCEVYAKNLALFRPEWPVLRGSRFPKFSWRQHRMVGGTRIAEFLFGVA
jgi:hypothetical protein